MEIKNGATVHQVWMNINKPESVDLICVVQYDSHAEAICKALIGQVNENCFLVMTNHYTGEMKIFRKDMIPPLCKDEGCPHFGTPHYCVEKQK